MIPTGGRSMDKTSYRYASPTDTTHSYAQRFGQTYRSGPRYASPADNAHKYSPALLSPRPITRTYYSPVRDSASPTYGQPAQILAPIRAPVSASLQYAQTTQISPRPTVPCGAYLLIGCSQSVRCTECCMHLVTIILLVL